MEIWEIVGSFPTHRIHFVYVETFCLLFKFLNQPLWEDPIQVLFTHKLSFPSGWGLIFLVQTLNRTGHSLCTWVCLGVAFLMWFSKIRISWYMWEKDLNSSNKRYFPIREEIHVRVNFYSKSYESSPPFTELLNRTALDFLWCRLGLLGSCWAQPLSWRALLPRAGCVAFCNSVPRENGAKYT